MKLAWKVLSKFKAVYKTNSLTALLQSFLADGKIPSLYRYMNHTNAQLWEKYHIILHNHLTPKWNIYTNGKILTSPDIQTKDLSRTGS